MTGWLHTHEEEHKGTTEPDEKVDGELFPPGKTNIFAVCAQEEADHLVGGVEGEQIDESKPSLSAAGNLHRLNLLILGRSLVLGFGEWFDGHDLVTMCG